MKIGILGTRGIPNHYGGFEQCTEHISNQLSQRGHNVWVYTSHDHPYQKSNWKNVQLIHQYNPENRLGTFGQFLYDFNCLMDARKRKFDVLLQLGYTSNAIFFSLWPKNIPNIVNMDGLEWKRSKYNKWVRKFLLFSEKLAAKHADLLIADSLGIKDYLDKKYKLQSAFIPYGGILFKEANPHLLPNDLLPFNYDLIIARMEKENNIECIINAFLKSQSQKTLVIVGSFKNKYGQFLFKKYDKEFKVKFLGSIYDINLLNNLRYYSHLYYHGHSVGGTNPSLIEAMSSNAMVIAHQNDFNYKILGKHAFYFSNEDELSSIIKTLEKHKKREDFIEENLKKVSSFYNWEVVTEAYERYMLTAIQAFNMNKSAKQLKVNIQ